VIEDIASIEDAEVESNVTSVSKSIAEADVMETIERVVREQVAAQRAIIPIDEEVKALEELYPEAGDKSVSHGGLEDLVPHPSTPVRDSNRPPKFLSALSSPEQQGPLAAMTEGEAEKPPTVPGFGGETSSQLGGRQPEASCTNPPILRTMRISSSAVPLLAPASRR
jgi:hypothetical protein